MIKGWLKVTEIVKIILILGCIRNKNELIKTNIHSVSTNHNESLQVNKKLNNSQIITNDSNHHQSLMKPDFDDNHRLNNTELKINKKLRYNLK